MTKVSQTKNEAPTLAEVIRLGVDSALIGLNTAMPGIVTSYVPETNLAAVQPVFMRTYADDTDPLRTVAQPVINDVPVCFPRANQAAITFPIKPGDTVLLIFSQRSLDKWKTTGGVVPPNDPRKHDLSDAIAIPGVYPSTNPVLVDPENLVVRHVLSKVTLKEDRVEVSSGAGLVTVDASGKVTLGNGVVELLALIDQLITQINLITVPTAVGPSGVPNNAAAMTAIQQQLAVIKE